MWLQHFPWATTTGKFSGEGTRSRLPFTEGQRVWYVQIWEKEPLIRHKDGNWSRWTIFRNAAAPIRVRKPIGRSVYGPK